MEIELHSGGKYNIFFVFLNKDLQPLLSRVDNGTNYHDDDIFITGLQSLKI